MHGFVLYRVRAVHVGVWLELAAVERDGDERFQQPRSRTAASSRFTRRLQRLVDDAAGITDCRWGELEQCCTCGRSSLARRATVAGSLRVGPASFCAHNSGNLANALEDEAPSRNAVSRPRMGERRSTTLLAIRCARSAPRCVHPTLAQRPASFTYGSAREGLSDDCPEAVLSNREAGLAPFLV